VTLPTKPKSVPPARAEVAARAALTGTGRPGRVVSPGLEPVGAISIAVPLVTGADDR
jgi:hypothetical protein